MTEKPWPENWRELIDKLPHCHRCGNLAIGKLYFLSNQHPEIEVCRTCSDDYHKHNQEFVNDIHERLRKRNRAI